MPRRRYRPSNSSTSASLFSKNLFLKACPLSMYTARGRFPSLRIARCREEAMACVFSLTMISKERNMPLAQSSQPTSVMRQGLPVSGLMTVKFILWPSATSTSPGSRMRLSRVM